MVHLFKNAKGQLETATISNGKYIVGSNQGYEKRSGVYSNIRAQMKSFGVSSCLFQDDTLDKPAIFALDMKNKPVITAYKPKKKYVPSKKTK